MFHFALINRSRTLLSTALLTVALLGLPQTFAAQTPRSPSETVQEFYKALREKRFRDAFGLSIYKPAIDGLKPEEFDDLKPDFEKVAGNVPDKVDISGEQISGETASVFIKVPRDDDPKQTDTEPIALIRENGVWIIGDKENEEIVRKAGNRFFLDARIDTHHGEVQAMMQKINLAQMIYSQQHAGSYADLPTLIGAGLLPKDIEGTDSTGYHFHLALAKDAKSFTVGAEPARYGRTGKLSFFMDQSGIHSGDLGGKPLSH